MTSSPPIQHRSALSRATRRLLALLLLYLVLAYLLIPASWMAYAHRRPTLQDGPRITWTREGIPGDPLNVALVGTELDVAKIMLDAQWYPADPLTLRSCLKIARASVFKQPYEEAPVSSLYLFGRKEDLAFQQPVGNNPRKRHHVRFWRWDRLSSDGRPVWFGSATYDERVGFSHTTGKITHHIDGDIDTERDHLVRDLQRSGRLAETYVVNGFHKIHQGRNGGGDRWHTDGSLSVAVLRPASAISP